MIYNIIKTWPCWLNNLTNAKALVNYITLQYTVEISRAKKSRYAKK